MLSGPPGPGGTAAAARQHQGRPVLSHWEANPLLLKRKVLSFYFFHFFSFTDRRVSLSEESHLPQNKWSWSGSGPQTGSSLDILGSLDQYHWHHLGACETCRVYMPLTCWTKIGPLLRPSSDVCAREGDGSDSGMTTLGVFICGAHTRDQELYSFCKMLHVFYLI